MLKKLIFASTLASIPGLAFAADLPVRSQMPLKAPPLQQQAFSWTGFYAGINIGGAFNDSERFEQSDSFEPTISSRTQGSGLVAGGQVGYNYEFSLGNLNGIVVGLETDAAYADVSSNLAGDPNAATFEGLYNVHNRMDFLGTVRGRLGYANDRFLIYGTGGFAYGNVEHNLSVNQPALGAVASTSFKTNETGFVYGGGVEYALPIDTFFHMSGSSAVTVRAEYLRYELNGDNANVDPLIFSGTSSSFKPKDVGNIARAAVNYKF
jgi:outer membrane immunogenic protein